MTMPRKLMLASIPSAGSDWLAECFTDAVPELITPAKASESYKDVKEWFNPICNQVAPHVAKYFGCELASTVSNLTRTISWDEVDAVMQQWPSGANFTKETFIVGQLVALYGRFDVVTLLRSAEHTFPPKRLRVWSWYQMIGKGLGMTTLDPSLWKAEAIAAHAVYSAMLERASIYEPLRWEKLVSATPGEVLAMLRAALPEWMEDHLLPIADRICATRSGCGRSL